MLTDLRNEVSKKPNPDIWFPTEESWEHFNLEVTCRPLELSSAALVLGLIGCKGDFG